MIYKQPPLAAEVPSPEISILYTVFKHEPRWGNQPPIRKTLFQSFDREEAVAKHKELFDTGLQVKFENTRVVKLQNKKWFKVATLSMQPVVPSTEQDQNVIQ